MDGHKLTVRLLANNLDTLHQVRPYSTFSSKAVAMSFQSPHAEGSYSTETRFSTQSLPVHITSVVCNSSSKGLIDCDYYEFPNSTTTSMDIHISCGNVGYVPAVDIESDDFSCELLI